MSPSNLYFILLANSVHYWNRQVFQKFKRKKNGRTPLTLLEERIIEINRNK